MVTLKPRCQWKGEYHILRVHESTYVFMPSAKRCFTEQHRWPSLASIFQPVCYWSRSHWTHWNLSKQSDFDTISTSLFKSCATLLVLPCEVRFGFMMEINAMTATWCLSSLQGTEFLFSHQRSQSSQVHYRRSCSARWSESGCVGYLCTLCDEANRPSTSHVARVWREWRFVYQRE